MSQQIFKRLTGAYSLRFGLRRYSSGDPYILPLSPGLMNKNTPTETPLPPRIHRENETVPALRARLIYQSRKRGMLEGDLILSTFAAEHLNSMNEKELQEFDRVCALTRLHLVPYSDVDLISC
jgi:succinate dehydrogenase flavin-adding protein (antitoxin of CptAB toxin-antitoxin module)